MSTIPGARNKTAPRWDRCHSPGVSPLEACLFKTFFVLPSDNRSLQVISCLGQEKTVPRVYFCASLGTVHTHTFIYNICGRAVMGTAFLASGHEARLWVEELLWNTPCMHFCVPWNPAGRVTPRAFVSPFDHRCLFFSLILSDVSEFDWGNWMSSAVTGGARSSGIFAS